MEITPLSAKFLVEYRAKRELLALAGLKLFRNSSFTEISSAVYHYPRCNNQSEGEKTLY